MNDIKSGTSYKIHPLFANDIFRKRLPIIDKDIIIHIESRNGYKYSVTITLDESVQSELKLNSINEYRVIRSVIQLNRRASDLSCVTPDILYVELTKDDWERFKEGLTSKTCFDIPIGFNPKFWFNPYNAEHITESGRNYMKDMLINMGSHLTDEIGGEYVKGNMKIFDDGSKHKANEYIAIPNGALYHKQDGSIDRNTYRCEHNLRPTAKMPDKLEVSIRGNRKY